MGAIPAIKSNRINSFCQNCLATHNGLEPMTSAVTGRRSNQLSHQAKVIFTNPSGSLYSYKQNMQHKNVAKWTLRDSNPGPTGYEPVALTS